MKLPLYLLLIASLVATPAKLAFCQKTSHTLRVVSYNIRHGEGTDRKVDLNRIAKVLSDLKPDLVALQEVDQNCRRSGNRDIAKELGRLTEMEHRFGKFMDFQGGEYGLAVLSRLPIVDSIRHPLPKGAEPRCALEVKVEAPGLASPLSFLSIHNDWTSEEIRVKQNQALLEQLGETTNPVILAGDFNAQRSGESMKLLERARWNILQKTDQKLGMTFPSSAPRVEIDFVVVRGLEIKSVEHDVIPEKIASDHRPIRAVISYSN